MHVRTLERLVLDVVYRNEIVVRIDIHSVKRRQALRKNHYSNKNATVSFLHLQRATLEKTYFTQIGLNSNVN